MLALMIYCLLIASFAALAARIAEPAVAALGGPRRMVWVAAFGLALLYPLVAISIANMGAVPTVIGNEGPALPAAAAAPNLGEGLSALPEFDLALKIIWILSSLSLMAFMLVGWFRLHALAVRTSTVMVNGTEVCVTEQSGPATFGVLRPKIIVPRWFLSRPEEEVRLVIAHELQHVAARDAGLMSLAFLLTVIMPWNLALWWMLRRLQFAVEADCDRRVLGEGVNLSAYGQALLAIAERSSLASRFAFTGSMALVEPVSQLEKRITIMKENKIKHAKKLMLAAAITSASLAVVAGQFEPPSADFLYSQDDAVLLAQNAEPNSDPREITLNFTNIPVRDLIKMISQFSDENIVVRDDVDGLITIQVKDMPWDEALDKILAFKSLERFEEGGIIFIRPAS